MQTRQSFAYNNIDIILIYEVLPFILQDENYSLGDYWRFEVIFNIDLVS